jgi:carbon storage regulator
LLVLTRKPGQTLIIDNQIKITITRIESNRVKVGIEAPLSMSIVRGELPPRGGGVALPRPSNSAAARPPRTETEISLAEARETFPSLIPGDSSMEDPTSETTIETESVTTNQPTSDTVATEPTASTETPPAETTAPSQQRSPAPIDLATQQVSAIGQRVHCFLAGNPIPQPGLILEVKGQYADVKVFRDGADSTWYGMPVYPPMKAEERPVAGAWCEIPE